MFDQFIMPMHTYTVVLLVAVSSCSLKNIAMTSLADTLSAPGTVYARDNDPELVKDSLPVIIKVMEQIRDELPTHRGLRLALCRTVTSYAVAFVQTPADELQESDVARARPLYARARKLLFRARNDGLFALDLVQPGLHRALLEHRRDDEKRLLAALKKEDAALLYWTAAAWGSAIATAKDDMALVGELPEVELLMQRALALDEAFDAGAIHEFFIAYLAGRDKHQGGGPERAREHFDRAKAINQGKKISADVTYAESVLPLIQDKKQFTALLDKVLAFDLDSAPDFRLVNTLAQVRARSLLGRTNDLFAE